MRRSGRRGSKNGARNRTQRGIQTYGAFTFWAIAPGIAAGELGLDLLVVPRLVDRAGPAVEDHLGDLGAVGRVVAHLPAIAADVRLRLRVRGLGELVADDVGGRGGGDRPAAETSKPGGGVLRDVGSTSGGGVSPPNGGSFAGFSWRAAGAGASRQIASATGDRRPPHSRARRA